MTFFFFSTENQSLSGTNFPLGCTNFNKGLKILYVLATEFFFFFSISKFNSPHKSIKVLRSDTNSSHWCASIHTDIKVRSLAIKNPQRKNHSNLQLPTNYSPADNREEGEGVEKSPFHNALDSHHLMEFLFWSEGSLSGIVLSWKESAGWPNKLFIEGMLGDWDINDPNTLVERNWLYVQMPNSAVRVFLFIALRLTRNLSYSYRCWHTVWRVLSSKLLFLSFCVQETLERAVFYSTWPIIEWVRIRCPVRDPKRGAPLWPQKDNLNRSL